MSIDEKIATGVPWWPPKVGDKLRRMGLGNVNHTLCHVVAVFETEHAPMIVVKEWREGNHGWRWYYEIQRIEVAFFGGLWPNGRDDLRRNRE